MSNNREISQFSSFVYVDDNTRNIGIATTATPYVGIGTTNPAYKLHVVGDTYASGIITANRIFSSIYGEFTGSSVVNDNLVGTALSISGISTLGVTSATNLTAQQLNVSGVSTFSGITTHTTSLFGTQASFTGIVTALSFSGNVSSATYATSSGIATYATNAGVATYATSAGVSTNLKGGVIGNIPYQNAADTTVFLTNGASGTILQSNGVGNAPTWVSAAPAAAITGLTVRDEGTVVGTANSVSTLNFVGSNITAIASGSISTITVSDNLVGTALSISGISTLGVTSTTNLTSQQLNVSGVSTFSGIATHTTSLFGTQASFTGVVTASSFSGSLALSNITGLAANVSTFLATPSSANLASAVTDETGSGSLVFATSPTLVSPTLGNANATTINVSGISTIGNFRITPVGSGATVGGIGVTYYGDGSLLSGISAGLTVTDDTSTNATRYILFDDVTSGTITGINVSSTKLTFNPSTGNLVAGGTVTANSDENLKTNIKTIENALHKVLSLRGVEYDRTDTGDHQIGVIAQEVQEIIPDVVYPKTAPDYETKSVAYGNLVGLLIEAIKEQNQKIAELERKLEEK